MLNENDLIKYEKELESEYNQINKLCMINSKKVIDAFHKFKVSESDLYGTIGYGYNDEGRDKIDNIFAYVLDAQAGLVRNQFVSGSHALNVCFQALLRPNDTLLSISGLPYDTLHEVIGIKENNSSLKSYGIKYKQIDLINNDFDYDKIKEALKENIKVIHIQRSRGYSIRESITIDKLEKVIKFIKNINKDVIIYVDNCYCEFVEEKSPCSVGADLCVGSLIKNLGAGIATNGAYAVGRKDLIKLVGERLYLPGEGSEVGPSENANRKFLLGLYFAPSVVSSALKAAILTSYILEKNNFKVTPKYNEPRADIVELIYFNNKEELIKYAQAIQSSGAIDSHVLPVPTVTPGYDDEVIMASPSFTQGSSIELSCDAPIREPLVLYQQGGLTYEYSRLSILNAINKLLE